MVTSENVFKPYRAFNPVNPEWSGITYQDLVKPTISSGEDSAIVETISTTLTTVTTTFTFGASAWFQDGTAPAPGIAWANDVDTGWYRIGADNVGASNGGVLSYDWDTSRMKLAAGYKLQLGSTAAPLGDGTEILPIVYNVNAGLRLIMENTNTGTVAHSTIGALSDENNDIALGMLNSGFTTTGVHVAGDGFVVLSHGAGTSTNQSRHFVIANRLSSGSLKFGAGDVVYATLLNTGLFGFNTTTARRRVDILDASSPQLRLTHTDNTDYAEWQVDTNGILTLTSSGLYTQIHKDGGGTVGGLTEGQLHFKTVSATANLTNAITFGAHSETSATDHNRAQAGMYFQSSNSAVELSFCITNNFLNGAVKRIALQTQGNFITTPNTDGHAVFNEDGVDADFRIESDTLTSAFFLDGANGNILCGAALEIDGDLNHDGANAGFRGSAPVALSAAYTPTNVTTDRAYDANSTSLDEIADVLGTLIADLQLQGLIG